MQEDQGFYFSNLGGGRHVNVYALGHIWVRDAMIILLTAEKVTK